MDSDQTRRSQIALPLRRGSSHSQSSSHDSNQDYTLITVSNSQDGRETDIQSVDVPPLSEILDRLPKVQLQHANAVEENGEPDIGSKAETQELYEGGFKCVCCINWVDTFPEDIKAQIEEKKESQKYALVVRKKKGHADQKALEMHSIVIQSPLLKKTLSEIFEGFDGITATLKNLIFHAPFHAFFYRWERINRAVEELEDPEALKHLQLLHAAIGQDMRETTSLKEDLLKHGVMTYNFLWTLYEPGTLLYALRDGQHRFYRLVRSEYCDQDRDRCYNLHCTYVDYDGIQYGCAPIEIRINYFSGTVSVTDLPVYPAEFVPGYEEVKQECLERGRKIVSMSGHYYGSYEGMMYQPGFQGYGEDAKRQINGRVMVDAEMYCRWNPGQKVILAPLDAKCFLPGLAIPSNNNGGHAQDRYSNSAPMFQPPPPPPPPPGMPGPDRYEQILSGLGSKKPEKNVELTEEQLLLCSPMVRGYCMTSKTWGRFYVDFIQEVKWNEDAFPSLVLPNDYKELILTFAESHLQNKSFFDDVIEGKGQGIIILLSGEPGVGKTLTAESLAEKMRLPLYTIGAASLGSDAPSVEDSFAQILELATKWSAVLLLDESDVFLETRSSAPTDLERNKLVSVFLRLLEYYRGILFLTTNRIESFDSAFQSRIHLTINYPNLSDASRLLIWRKLISRSKDLPSVITDDELERLASIDINGREIKNVVKTAQLLARRHERALCVQDVYTVMRITQMVRWIPDAKGEMRWRRRRAALDDDDASEISDSF